MTGLQVSESVKRDDSAWTTARTLATPAAKLYSEWMLLVHDLKYSLRRAQLWKELLTAELKSDQDNEICVSLIRDAVISMVSCFDNRLPACLDPFLVYANVPGGLEYYKWLKDMRDTWIAHRSGPNRQCKVAIAINEQSGEFHGIGHLSHMYLGPKAEASDDLIRMVRIALEHAIEELSKHEKAVRSDVQKLKDYERLGLPVAQTVVPGSGEIHMGRKKFDNVKRVSKRKRPS